MNIYFLFGKAGSGKSFIGNHLRDHYHWHHFDADQLLTEELKTCIALERLMPTTLIDDYMAVLTRQIRAFYETQTKPIVISQAMYRNKNRLDLQQTFPSLQLIWVTAEDSLCYQRIQQRNDTLSVRYAQKIMPLFEPPEGFTHDLILNNGQELDLTPFVGPRDRLKTEQWQA
jgi:gluconate kinase